MALCRSCTAFDIQKFARNSGYTRGSRLEGVQAAALLGCKFCAALIETLGDTASDAKDRYGSDTWVHLFMTENYQIKRARSASPGGLSLNKLEVVLAPRLFQLTTGSSVECITSSHDFCVVADPESDAARSGDVIGRYLGNYSGSVHHFEMMQEWLAECMSHENCHRTASHGTIAEGDVELPTRCIDVMRDPPCLQHTTGQRGFYTTLSHRWNHETGRCRTVIGNLEERQTAIDMETLSATFKDAIRITKRLGIRYLWIDTICIIQDDSRDWQSEAPRMAKYYQLSVLTIAAAESTGSRGCLFERPPIIPGELIKLPYRSPSGSRKGIFYVYRRPRPLVDEYRESVMKCPLLQRGWVFQERILSRRIIYFTNTQIYLECKTSDPKNECQETLPINLGSVGLSPYAGRLALKNDFFTQTQRGDRVEESWYEAVERYSSLGLSCPEKDRIFAIAGLEAEFRNFFFGSPSNNQSVLPGEEAECVFGLWFRDIHRGLLWQHSGEGPAIKSGCEVPSWSWASYSSKVSWRHREDLAQKSCEILPQILAEIRHTKHSSTGLADDESSRNIARERSDMQELHFHSELERREANTLLHVLGAPIPAMIGPILPDKMEDDVGNWTGCTRRRGEGLWRAVSDAKSPEFIIGWADIERPEIKDQLLSYERTPVYALSIFVHKTRGYKHGWTFAYFASHHEVHEVLFLQKVGVNDYERIGIGRIFHEDFFRDVHAENIRLR